MIHVVIPVKDNVGLTTRLLADLTRDGHDSITVIDNGSRPGQYRRLEAVCAEAGATLVNMPGVGIHTMWNAGLDAAPEGCHTALLNNDIRLSDMALWKVAVALDADPLLAVACPSYDARRGTGVLYVDGICAGRYDGSGGLAGFAMVLDRRWDYRFPEPPDGPCWWFGDTACVFTAQRQRLRAGIVLDAHCVHVEGGSQTGKWDDPTMQRILQRDRDWFERTWMGVPSRS